jgi:hypothetical protein
MPKEEEPKPFDDVRKGLGLLFRAARTAVKNLPTDPIEKVVVDGAREVGRAVENVASTIEKELFGTTRTTRKSAPPTPPADPPKDDATPSDTPPDDDSKGPRVE